MSDIVERLRIWNPTEVEAEARLLDAAEEIERLRAHIAEIEKWKDEGERIIGPEAKWSSGRTSTIVRPSALFQLGAWWERRPWKRIRKFELMGDGPA